jgi:hypothetical protein
MQHYSDIVFDRYGNVVANKAVSVYQGGSLATVYASDSLGSPTDNPLTTDSKGKFSFYAPNGEYTLRITNADDTTSDTDITLIDPDDLGSVRSVAGVSPTAGDVPAADLKTALSLSGTNTGDQDLSAYVTSVAGVTPTAGDVSSASLKTALSLSGTNTGDQDLSGYVPTSRTVNGHALSSDITLIASDIAGTGLGGGSTFSGNLTLTSSSLAAQIGGFTAQGQVVQLPDATTCSKGVNLWAITNNSQYFGTIKDNGGTKKGFIAPYTTVLVSLASNSTANGTWGLQGAALYGITAVYRPTNDIGGNGAARMCALDLGSNRTMLVWGASSIRAVVLDDSTPAFGTEVAVRTGLSIAGSYQWSAIVTSTDKVLVVSDSSTARQGVILSVLGSTITVNTAGTATLSAGANGMGEIVQVGSAFVVSYSRATNVQALMAATISGTTVSFGAEVTLSTTGLPGSIAAYCHPHVYAIDSSNLLAIGVLAASSTCFAKPYSISGNTLSAGTAASFGTSSQFTFRTHAMASGRWLMLYAEGGTNISAALISYSAGTATASVVTNLSSTSVSTPGSTNFDSAVISSTKAVVTNVNTGTITFNIVSDNGSGTISKGTDAALNNTSAAAQGAIIGVNGNNVRVASWTDTQTNDENLYTVDCSGASPSFLTSDTLSPGAVRGCNPSQNYNGKRYPGTVRCGAGRASLLDHGKVGGLITIIGDNEPMLYSQTPVYFSSNNVILNNTSGAGVMSDYEGWIPANLSRNNGGIPSGAMYRVSGAQP